MCVLGCDETQFQGRNFYFLMLRLAVVLIASAVLHIDASTMTGTLYGLFGYDFQREKCTKVPAQACENVAPYYCRVGNDECDVANPLTAWMNANRRCHLHKNRVNCDNDKTALREGVTLCYWDEDECQAKRFYIWGESHEHAIKRNATTAAGAVVGANSPTAQKPVQSQPVPSFPQSAQVSQGGQFPSVPQFPQAPPFPQPGAPPAAPQ